MLGWCGVGGRFREKTPAVGWARARAPPLQAVAHGGEVAGAAAGWRRPPGLEMGPHEKGRQIEAGRGSAARQWRARFSGAVCAKAGCAGPSMAGRARVRRARLTSARRSGRTNASCHGVGRVGETSGSDNHSKMFAAADCARLHGPLPQWDYQYGRQLPANLPHPLFLQELVDTCQHTEDAAAPAASCARRRRNTSNHIFNM